MCGHDSNGWKRRQEKEQEAYCTERKRAMESRKITPGSLVGNETNIWSFTRGCTCLQNGCKLTPVLLYKARKTRQMQITFISMCAPLWPSMRNSAKQITAMLCADERACYVFHHRWTAYLALVACSCFFFSSSLGKVIFSEGKSGDVGLQTVRHYPRKD